MFTYSAFGLVLNSNEELPGFKQSFSEIPDIFIYKACEKYSKSTNDYTIISEFTDEVTNFRWNGVAEYAISSGSSIIYHPYVECCQNLALLPFYGFVIAALLVQRGLFVLHGSCVSINGKAVVIVGPKGYGKSTLTAILLENGYKFISDDVTAVSFANGIHVVPGIPVIKLWPDSLQAIGKEPDDFSPINSLTTKRSFIVNETSKLENSPISLAFIIALSPSSGENYTIERLNPINATLCLLGNSYLSRFHSSLPPTIHRSNLYQSALIAKQSIVSKLCFNHYLPNLQKIATQLSDSLFSL